MPKVNASKILHHVSVSILFISSSLLSAQLIAAPNWQGPYIGGYLGGGLSEHKLSTDMGTVTNTTYFSSSANLNAVNNAASAINHPNSGLVGIQAGHDWIWQQIVYGLAFDYGLFSQDASKNITGIYPDNSGNYSVSTSMETNWLFTLRGRVGYQTMLYWPSLFYITTGMAMTQIKIKNNFSDITSLAGVGGTHHSENKIGWTVGAGVEFFTFKQFSVNLEYLYIHFPSVKSISSITNMQDGFGIPMQSLTSPFSTNGQINTNILRIGINYRFDE